MCFLLLLQFLYFLVRSVGLRLVRYSRLFVAEFGPLVMLFILMSALL